MTSAASDLVYGRYEAELKPVHEYLPFVRTIAMRVARRLPAHVELEDLISAGVVGLIESMNRYDSSRSNAFEKFAEFRIRGAILDELRRRDLMARDARLESKNLENSIDSLTRELARTPEEEEIAQRLGLDVEGLRTKMEKLTPVRVLSFTEVFPVSSVAGDDDPFDSLAKKELMAALAKGISKLNKRHQQVLALYYTEDLTLKDIGYILDVTESRVCQILSEATLRLRSMLNPEGVAEAKRAKRSKEENHDA